MAFPPEVWGGVLHRLKSEVSPFSYQAWLEPLIPHALARDGASALGEAPEPGLLLLCPSTFHRDRVRSQLLPLISECVSEAAGKTVRVELEVAGEPQRRGRTRRAEQCDEESEMGGESRGESGVAIRDAKASSEEGHRAVRQRLEGEGGREPAALPDDASLSSKPAAALSKPAAALSKPAAALSEPAAALSEPAAAPGASASTPSGVTSVAGRGAHSDPRSNATPPVRIRPRNVNTPSTGARPQPVVTRRGPDTAGGPASGLSYTFDNFVVGPCNALAREASLVIAQARQRGVVSQVYLSSAPGMGKTHLARAVAAEATRLGTGEVRYASAEGFTNDFLTALRARKTDDFKRHYRRRCKLLVVEDIQFLQSKDATQLEFFHTVQHVLDAGGRVLLTGDRVPRALETLSDRLRSKLGSGFVAELEPPDAQVRRAILRNKAAHGGVHLPADCLDYLVEGVRGSVRELESVLIQLVTTASLLKRPIDQALTEQAVAQKLTSTRNDSLRLQVSDVIDVVAGYYRKTPEELASSCRRKEFLVPRQLAMYLSRRFTDASIAEIGRALGRDHPAVRNAIRKVEREILEQAKLRYRVESLIDRLDQLLAERGARLS